MATPVEQIQQLMQELGPATPDIDAVVQTEEPSWAIQFSDETIVIIEPAEDPERMVLSAELGSASDTLQLPIYETLLCYNLLWKDTGGVKMALSGPGGELVLLYELFSANLTLNELQTVLSNFVSIAQIWTVYVTGESEQPGMPLPGSMDMLQLGA